MTTNPSLTGIKKNLNTFFEKNCILSYEYKYEIQSIWLITYGIQYTTETKNIAHHFYFLYYFHKVLA